MPQPYYGNNPIRNYGQYNYGNMQPMVQPSYGQQNYMQQPQMQAMPQMQQMQGLQQPQMPQQVIQTIGLQGKMVDGLEVVKATDIPLDRKYKLFSLN